MIKSTKTSKTCTYTESPLTEAARVARQLRGSEQGERFLITISAIDTLQEMFGGVDGPVRHESDYRAGTAQVWLT